MHAAQIAKSPLAGVEKLDDVVFADGHIRHKADAKRQVIANEQWQTVQEEDRQNQELLGLSHEILSLVAQVHALSGATATEPAQNGR